jgi:hypothetical protein
LNGVELNWNGDELIAAMANASNKSLNKAANHLLNVSGEQGPHDEGTLQASGTVIEMSDGSFVVTYGLGPAAPYALRQHEDMTMSHQKGRKAKYLEDPMNSEKDTLLKILTDGLGDALK